MSELHDNISEQQTKHPKAFFIVAGDFNQARLKSVLPKFYQHVKLQPGQRMPLTWFTQT